MLFCCVLLFIIANLIITNDEFVVGKTDDYDFMF